MDFMVTERFKHPFTILNPNTSDPEALASGDDSLAPVLTQKGYVYGRVKIVTNILGKEVISKRQIITYDISVPLTEKTVILLDGERLPLLAYATFDGLYAINDKCVLYV